ncbi:MAG: hypothetical protein ACLP9C_07990 [Acidimicrobiales bacterium]
MSDDELWAEVGGLLETRPGWSLQASSTPGAPPSWCFGSGGEVDLSVVVDAGSIWVYVMETDRDIRVAGTRELTAWLDEHEAASVNDPGQVVDDLLHAKIVEWGRSND